MSSFSFQHKAGRSCMKIIHNLLVFLSSVYAPDLIFCPGILESAKYMDCVCQLLLINNNVVFPFSKQFTVTMTTDCQKKQRGLLMMGL